MTDEIMQGQIMLTDLLGQDSWCGKTCQEHSAATKEKILEPSLKKQPKSQTKMPLFLDLRTANGHIPDVSWEMGGPLPGEYTMHSFGESPSEERESRLSQILEANAHQKYYLSEKACQGILRRAEKRGKKLPEMLEQALKRQAGLSVSKNEQENLGGGKGILIQNERTGALSTLNNQSVCAFEPGAASRVGGHMYDDDKAGTVRANAGDNQQAVVYGISSYDSNAMKSDNPHSGIYEADTSRTLDLNGGNPGCNQGGMAVVCIEGNGQRESHKGDGYKESDTMYTLNTVEQHAVCIENHPADSRVKISEDGVVQTLSGRMGTGGGNVPMVMETEPILLANNQNEAEISQTGVCNTLPAAMGMGGGYVPMITETYQKTTGSLCASGYDKLGTQEAANDMFVVQSSWDGSQVSPTLTANNANGSQRMPDKDNFNAVISAEVYHCTSENDKVQTLKARDYKDPQVVAYGLDRASYNQGENAQYNFSVDEEKVGTCVAKGPNAVCKAVDCLNGRKKDVNGTLAANARKSLNSGNVVRCESVVRRLTPMECERLQGFPDGWTDIGDWVDSKGKTHKGDSDSPRYKALGNSIALPFWQWMAERMIPYLPENPTMASLFSGIGGFELVYARAGVKPIWNSEIESYPEAVTRVHFGNGENDDGDYKKYL